MVEIDKELFKKLKTKLRSEEITEEDFDVILNDINKIHVLEDIITSIEKKIVQLKEETDNTVNKLNEKIKILLNEPEPEEKKEEHRIEETV
jgi:hypothetical protein|nr:MAG TPA: hypothetical protein [Caudoviricetes sp.]